MDKVNLAEKLARFDDHWSPRVVGELNGQHVKLVKFLGEFVWHKHDHEDELFLVVHGRFRMEFRDRQVWLEEGEFLIVPRGVEHRPVAEEEVHVLLFEPAGTLNTGDVRDERTVESPSGSDSCPERSTGTPCSGGSPTSTGEIGGGVSSGPAAHDYKLDPAAARRRDRGVRGTPRGLAARGLPALHRPRSATAGPVPTTASCPSARMTTTGNGRAAGWSATPASRSRTRPPGTSRTRSGRASPTGRPTRRSRSRTG